MVLLKSGGASEKFHASLEVLSIFIAPGSNVDKATCRSALASCYREFGNIEEAISQCRMGLSLLVQCGDSAEQERTDELRLNIENKLAALLKIRG
ncbi:hypothetical protein FNU76_10665 [Chitinimonas arctica]|uniref:Tetratricopeptide repeat protein n=1 Tax=Chitinimonas arctica TaxID=2594795 RepID=A0A516SFI4_9NEIS|nr:hypothetical protein [Chitinimonas arctica]QDQ26788.1 hypothetical protein FNU76_10665 [Chitinimonas arctica]